ncbi:MAG TPA: transglycosylase SLT domain-containing protein [Cytophaga sp.]|nr:transglycosylase SLT domain-containing protein [Cytophaga sp.]
MRFFSLPIFFGIFLLLSGCNRTNEQGFISEKHNTDSPNVIKEESSIPDAFIENPLRTHKLKLLITNNINTFFLYKGENFGLEFELLQLFLKSKHIDLEIELIKDVEHIRDSLHARGAYMAAATFIEPKNKLARVLYSDPIYTTDIVLVKHKDNAASTSNPVVIEDAPYVRRLWSTDTSIFMNIKPTYSTQLASQQKLLTQVHSKEIESTIADANEASIVTAFYPDIFIDTILEHDAPVVFMFHPKMDTLRIEFNSWLKKNKNTTDYRWILQKYAMLPEKINEQLAITSIHTLTRKISSYDKIIKKYAATINWDWRLIASLIHQESKFNPSTKSWVGACGLMQLMPNTAYHHSHMTKKQLFIPSYNLKAGTHYIHWLESNFFNDSTMSESEKEKMILAAYNAGAGHVTDAQALCRKYQLDPNVWEGNVEKMILAKSEPRYYNDPICKHGYCRGEETSTYVKNILFYYKNYCAYFKK